MILMTQATKSLLLLTLVVVEAVVAVEMIPTILMTLPTRSLLLLFLENVVAVAVGDHLSLCVDMVAKQPLAATTCLPLQECQVAEHPAVSKLNSAEQAAEHPAVA